MEAKSLSFCPLRPLVLCVICPINLSIGILLNKAACYFFRVFSGFVIVFCACLGERGVLQEGRPGVHFFRAFSQGMIWSGVVTQYCLGSDQLNYWSFYKIEKQRFFYTLANTILLTIQHPKYHIHFLILPPHTHTHTYNLCYIRAYVFWKKSY